MSRTTENKIVLITRKTRLDDLVARYNTLSQAQFYVEHLGADFSDYQREHNLYREMTSRASEILDALGRLQTIDRSFLPNFIFGPKDIVVVLGQDGLVANTLKYLDKHPVIGVNPDPGRWEGVLLPFSVDDLPRVIPELFDGRRNIRSITMAQANLNDGQALFGVNDIFIGPKSHTSLRYSIQQGKRTEEQSSSGVIVSTGLGSTGWLKSILAGARGVMMLNKPIKAKSREIPGFPWDAQFLYYTVREPFPSKASAAGIVFGRVTPEEPLILISHTPDTGVIFSDGIESDFLQFPSGMEARISVSTRAGHLVV
jgi:NAD kinase